MEVWKSKRKVEKVWQRNGMRASWIGGMRWTPLWCCLPINRVAGREKHQRLGRNRDANQMYSSALHSWYEHQILAHTLESVMRRQLLAAVNIALHCKIDCDFGNCWQSISQADTDFRHVMGCSHLVVKLQLKQC